MPSEDWSSQTSMAMISFCRASPMAQSRVLSSWAKRMKNEWPSHCVGAFRLRTDLSHKKWLVTELIGGISPCLWDGNLQKKYEMNAWISSTCQPPKNWRVQSQCFHPFFNSKTYHVYLEGIKLTQNMFLIWDELCGFGLRDCVSTCSLNSWWNPCWGRFTILDRINLLASRFQSQKFQNIPKTASSAKIDVHTPINPPKVTTDRGFISRKHGLASRKVNT